jgi:DNA-binding winged helix-turn-helix (wHTH) protein/TolB-like protein/tetratricopeptide (TPR) repeat protein
MCLSEIWKSFGKDLETANGNKNGHLVDRLRFAFDEFEVDPTNRLLLRNGDEVPLTGKVFDVLLVFAENPGRLLAKEEIIEKVWDGSFVEEGNLARNVSTLRKALGDEGKDHKYIITVQGRGYRFAADVSRVENIDSEPADSPVSLSQKAGIPEQDGAKHFPRRWFLIISSAVLFLTAAVWIGGERFLTPTNQIKSLAVLPLKTLDAGDNYLGVGIADAVIRRVSQTRQLTVRPTSAVLHYVNNDTDGIAAAKELNADAVLEGTVQRAGDRLRVSVNLLRTGDGASLWADNFDMPAADIFVIQDNVARQVATRLRLHLNATQTTGSENEYPANPVAYEFYIKGIFSLDQRGGGEEALPQMQATIDLLKKAVEADPNYALAHAQLAWAYVWTAQFIEPAEPNWAELARQEIDKADELDADLAETHQAKAMLFWSKYENFQNDAAIRELLIAQQLNPNTSHGELAGILGHLGLEERAVRELNRALEIDPTSRSLKDLKLILPFLRSDADAWLIERQKKPLEFTYYDPWYYLRKDDLDDAKKAIGERVPRGQKYPDFLMIQALYFALKGDFHESELRAPGIIAMIQPEDQSRHHVTYNAACIYALAGRSSEAVKWLRETADTGFPNYPLFARDPFLDPIRQNPEFVSFLAEQKDQFERFQQEFGEQ